ncbi:MAG: carboxypeptidase regulatory-like domain-containing protein [Bacteroidota bacterium]
MKTCLVVVLGIALLGAECRAQQRAKYQVIEVNDGGTITGVVKFVGKAPGQKKLTITKNKEVCAKQPVFSEEILVSKGTGGLKNVVVSIVDITKGAKLEISGKRPAIDQSGCVFRPHVQLVAAGSKLEILNNDGILHNFHTYGIKNRPINLAQPKAVKKLKVSFANPEIIKVGCDVHNWMSAWIIVKAHPYYARTDDTGKFEMTNVPPGTYLVQFWHEALGMQEKKVTVKPKTASRVNVEFAAK